MRAAVFKVSTLAALVLCLPAATAAAEQTLRERLVGTWKIVSVQNTRPDGSVVELFGANPRGIAVFDANGNTVIVLMRSDRPKFAANNRDLGTAEENGATVRGTHAYFGTYSVNEADQALVFHVEGNTFPNQEGIDTTRFISMKGDEFSWITPAPSVGGKSVAVWKRVSR